MRLDKAIRTLSKQRGNIEEVKALKIALFDAGLVISNHESEEESVKAEYTKIHKPKDVADFIKLFNDPNGLKFLIHDFDGPDQEFNVTTYLSKAKKSFKKYSREYEIPKSLYKVIQQFGFTESPAWWINDSLINQGWSTSEWLAWSKQHGHPLKSPDFEKIIQSFRELTRIKPSATPLEKIVKSVVEKQLAPPFNTEFLKLNNADFYTQTDDLRKALGAIFYEIRQYKKYTNVSVKYESTKEIDGYRQRVLKICQYGSYPYKDLDEVIEKYKQKGGELTAVRNYLFGYCDWYVETIWNGRPVRVHFLKELMKSDEVKVEIEDLSASERDLPGFTHTLIFYYR